MIMRAESCVTVSSTWPAKNTMAVSMIANSSAKNTGATSANSTAAEPRRLRRKRRSVFLTWPSNQQAMTSINPRAENSSRKHYPKLIVEVFREIDAECTAPLTAR